ncbi:Rrf2 family transcriptional regulator [Sphingomonas sp. CGMCC 1.13654]|uniref:Rrf2 family transcriptional regulator n=1 Tax=Sphingomonas chungangi TaxID=2683589 RepID=A0A838L9E9_9SPHN|nr:Rrf2 family transcriptional regulator [Sphingomonas chungangi]MBA2935345.1 Rrf2 family transcriptional regulator [Sphingomonas chungangi]MVW56852.1 Rrf2 family transcriptional regulator [Sphingomonas chungangi]
MLAQKTRYALRALLYLAEAEPGRSVQVADIAATQQVPRKYLELILLDLKKAGMVASRRGPGGGYVLARAPAQISFAEVIRLMDGPLALVPCASLNFYARCGDCHDEATCAIRKVMAQVRVEADRILSGTTLADAAAIETLAA